MYGDLSKSIFFGREGADCIAERTETLLSVGHLIECWREKRLFGALGE